MHYLFLTMQNYNTLKLLLIFLKYSQIQQDKIDKYAGKKIKNLRHVMLV